MKQIRLLIIDQHRGVRDALSVRFRSAHDVRVVDTVTANRAKQLAQKGLQLDIALLGLTGRNDRVEDVVELVKLLVEGGTAVLALTSFIDDKARRMILQAGASGYRLKNIDTPALLAEISLLAKSKN